VKLSNIWLVQENVPEAGNHRFTIHARNTSGQFEHQAGRRYEGLDDAAAARAGCDLDGEPGVDRGESGSAWENATAFQRYQAPHFETGDNRRYLSAATTHHRCFTPNLSLFGLNRDY
jgi:hypothetical protein